MQEPKIYRLYIPLTDKTIMIESEWLEFIKYCKDNISYGTLQLELRNGKPYEVLKAIEGKRFLTIET